ncbi:MAG: ATP-binding domain-containing protein, partial [Myxococcales bacterium]|nr:ATP-binding domain-containing protein [Myxococcales bacterium]
LYQLPPVLSREESQVFQTFYKSPYFFSARVFESISIELLELEKVYRQKDQEFVTLLNRIRNNSMEREDIVKLNSRFDPEFKPNTNDFFIHLTTTNKKADEINDRHTKSLTSRMHCFKAEITGDFGKEYYPSAPYLDIKLGSQVMLLNNDARRRYVNGSMGIVESIKTIDGEDNLGVRLKDNDRLVYVTRFTWEVVRFKVEGDEIKSESVGTFTQFPVRLAWAVTIHKSQGKTFENVILDVGNGAFAPGQIYVGLSRCTSFEGIVLSTPIHRHHIHTDSRIIKFLTSFQYQKSAEHCSNEEKIALLNEAIAENVSVEMIYLKVNDTKLKRVIKPLKVGKESYRGKLFPALRAWCDENSQEQIFHVGRILELSKTR